MSILVEGCVTVVRPEDLEAKLARSLSSGRPLKVKAGFDPSAPHIHLGHTVLMGKMRQFQDLGHEVHYVVGDFTAMIGDPSGRSKTRPVLTREQIRENALTYQSQAVKILDPGRTVIEHNARWLEPLSFADVIRLAAKTTVATMLQRDDFKKRLDGGIPISLHELLYPIAQAYDSVSLEADVELGGTDQTWNLLLGRDLMREHGQEPQVVMTTPLLEGTDGVQKMSKSLGNTIDVADPPAEKFGKVMSISDELMGKYRRHLRHVPGFVLEDEGGRHPMELKKELAASIIRALDGREAADEARASFERQFQQRRVPDEVPEVRLDPASLPLPLVAVLVTAGAAASRSEARRLIEQGAVEVDGARVTDPKAAVDGSYEGKLTKVGKRHHYRLRLGGH